jgi:hypothetical protein
MKRLLVFIPSNRLIKMLENKKTAVWLIWAVTN